MKIFLLVIIIFFFYWGIRKNHTKKNSDNKDLDKNSTINLSNTKPAEEKSYNYKKAKVSRTISYVDDNGYRRFINSDILVHRYIASKKLGRILHRNEVVHHIDGNKLNNRPDNLEVCTWEEHNNIHYNNYRNYGNWHGPEYDY